MIKQTIFFVLAVAFQLAILASVPAKQIHARLTGRLITIRTAPVDPYDLLSGYHVVLTYEISRPSPEQWGGLADNRSSGTVVYAVLKQGPENVWQLERLAEKLPQDLGPDQIALQGKIQGNRIAYGIEHFFIPEEGRRELESALRQNQQRALAEIRVDRYGHAALIRLIVNGKPYEY
jgi:uncharacterized membrane-anchored protein